MSHKLILVAALSGATRAVAHEGSPLWKLDQHYEQHLKNMRYHPVIMGRKMWESNRVRRTLVGIRTIVLSTTWAYKAHGASVATTALEALHQALQAPGSELVYVLGGQKVWEQFLPMADHIQLAEVDSERDGDTKFPAIDERTWCIQSITANWIEENGINYRLISYMRR